jgi:transcriptional regulator with XRE-family HTH domain
MSEQLNTINERLKHLRKNVLRLTQSELGNTLGLGKAAVSKMESNTSTITEQNIKLICKEFNVNYDWLVDGKGEIFIDTDRAAIELLADDYKLRPVEVSLIEEFVKLDEEERDVLLNYLQNVFLKNGQ